MVSYFYPYSKEFSVAVNNFLSINNTHLSTNVNHKIWVELSDYTVTNVFIVHEITQKFLGIWSVHKPTVDAQLFFSEKFNDCRIITNWDNIDNFCTIEFYGTEFYISNYDLDNLRSATRSAAC